MKLKVCCISCWVTTRSKPDARCFSLTLEHEMNSIRIIAALLSTAVPGDLVGGTWGAWEVAAARVAEMRMGHDAFPVFADGATASNPTRAR